MYSYSNDNRYDPIWNIPVEHPFRFDNDDILFESTIAWIWNLFNCYISHWDPDNKSTITGEPVIAVLLYVLTSTSEMYLESMELKLEFKPIWPKRTSTIGSIYSGTFDGSAATFMLVKVCYQAFHWPLALLSTILACLSSISWLRTIFF